MQNQILNSIRSLNLGGDGCKGGSNQVYAVSTSPAGHDKPHHHHHHHHHQRQQHHRHRRTTSHDSGSHRRTKSLPPASVCPEALLPYGLPSPDLIDPPIEPFLRTADQVSALASSFRRLTAAAPDDRCDLHLQQHSLLRSLNDPKLLRRSLRCARLHAADVHHKIVLSAWLRFDAPPRSPWSSACGGQTLECPRAALLPGYDPDFAAGPCPCRRTADSSGFGSPKQQQGEDDGDVAFLIGDEEVVCNRHKIAALSKPFRTMMYGGFMESQGENIDFTHNGISAEGMRAVDVFSRTASLDGPPPEILLELLSFSNKFCCEGLKSACDARLASLVAGMEDALLLVENGLEETATLLVGSCLQVLLRLMPRSLRDPRVTRILCTGEGRRKLASAGHASFALYYFLSQVAMEEESIRSNTTVMLLERLAESAESEWQRQLALHQLGCAMLERDDCEAAQGWFEAAAKAGHVYSLAGAARAMYRQGNRYSAFKQLNSLVMTNDHVGWAHQERSLYCSSMEEKMRDLNDATRLDPTLVYPYKYRAIILMEDNILDAAIAEINKVLGFKASADCLELRAWFSMALEDYGGALRDIRALMSLDPDYMMFHGRVHGDRLVEALQQLVQRWSLADCWIQLYDGWSRVDDVGSLAVLHQMLANDPGKSFLWFRQSLLLLRLNSQKAAMRSLRLARSHSPHEHERLVYEGWMLYETGHRGEALAMAEESLSIRRSFEAFFLKAYVLADESLNADSSSYVVHLLEEALRCPSDGLRKGQALNNLGSVYADCDKLDLAADCYVNAIKIRHTRAHQGLARVYFLKDRRKAAYEEMTRLIEKAPGNASAYEKRSEYCDRDMARCDLRKTTELDPLRTYPYRYRAAVLMDERKEDEAVAELSRAIAFRPELQLLHLRAAFLEAMGKAADAARDCEAALCLAPGSRDTLELYGRVRGRANQEATVENSRSNFHSSASQSS